MILIDTNLLSELRKVSSGKADASVAAWSDTVAPQMLYLSAISIFEVSLGIERLSRRDRAQSSLYATWLSEVVEPSFRGRILPVDATVARRWAALQVPDPRPILDSAIAATALVHGFAVATRNVRDFTPMGVAVLNPWEAV